MGKTERILGHLPATFSPSTRRSALQALADAVGVPLQHAENLLLEAMKAHWVDHADRGRALPHDLTLFAALYGVEPRDDESAVEFRRRLKDFVRIYLEGAATVRGLLRIAAHTLGVRIDHEDLERPDELRFPRRDDATSLLFGFSNATSRGADAQGARVVGRVNLSFDRDLRATPQLALRVDGATRTVDFAAAISNLESVSWAQITAAINEEFEAEVALLEGDFGVLVSPTAGESGTIQLLGDTADDAADAVFGIGLRVAQGADATSAQLVGETDLSGGIDLDEYRYLRLSVDQTHLAEIDLGPGTLTLDAIRDRINAALGIPVARHDGRFLILESSLTGSVSVVEVLPAAGNDAVARILGRDILLAIGDSARPAELFGNQSLNTGVDLSARSTLVLKIDSEAAMSVDCAGANPESTTLQEIIDRINAAVGSSVASTDGVILQLTSPTVGSTSRLEVLTDAASDAADAILGLAPRLYRGTSATRARIEALVTVPEQLDLRWQRRVEIQVDDAPLQTVDLAGAEPRRTHREEIVSILNDCLGQAVATLEDGRLQLISPQAGAESRLEVKNRDQVESVRYVTRAPVTDEATETLFGVAHKSATGTDPTVAELAGRPDLSRGVDLRRRSFLRVGVDTSFPIDVDCRGARPRVTSLTEVVTRLEEALGPGVASADTIGKHLLLRSRLTGSAGRIVVERSTATNASELLLGFREGSTFGEAARGVVFRGTRDLSAGLDVAERYLVKIAIDGQPAQEIDLRGDLANQPELPEIRIDLEEIIVCLDAALGEGHADHDGIFIILQSALTGSASALGFEIPSEPDHDATDLLFGMSAPRKYTGRDAMPAELKGTAPVTTPRDLSTRRHLRVTVDGGSPTDVDCSGDVPAATTLSEVVQRINAVLGQDVARDEAGLLVLRSTLSGLDSSVSVTPSDAGDATEVILGDEAVGVHQGQAAEPAVLDGEVAFSGSKNLSERSLLRVQVDEVEPRLIDVAGAEPSRTFPDEIISALNEAFPTAGGTLARRTAEGHLRLTGKRRVAVMPLRHFSLFEFPVLDVEPVQTTVVHGTEWTVSHDGIDPAAVVLRIATTRGVVGPTIHERSTGTSVRVPSPVPPGGILQIAVEGGQTVAHVNGTPVDVEVYPPGALLFVPPGISSWQYTECFTSRFDFDRFDPARFADGECREPGVFDVSRFGEAPGHPNAMFAQEGAMVDSGTTVTLTWTARQVARLNLELPYDLQRKFGGRFDEARFADAATVAPQATGLILELEPVAGSLISWVKENSMLIEAEGVRQAPVDLTPRTVPLDDPVNLEAGDATTPARLAVTEDGLDGYVVLRARQPGEWSNRIQVTLAGGDAAGTYKLTVAYAGDDVFENAVLNVQQQIVAARAAGVEAFVTRRSREVDGRRPGINQSS